MTYYPDLSSCTYFGDEMADQIIAVGWLDKEKPYTQGTVSEPFLDKLIQLLVKPWAPVAFLGFAECPYCDDSDFLTYKGTTIPLGNDNLFVPDKGFLYAAPGLIAHYIIAHQYAPPQEFRDAVIRCPTMSSTEYFQAIAANGPKEFADSARKKF